MPRVVIAALGTSLAACLAPPPMPSDPPADTPSRAAPPPAPPVPPAFALPDLPRWAAVTLLVIVVALAAAARLQYLTQFDSSRFEMGGDNAHHFNLAHNIAAGRGPVTDFVFSYWFRHPGFPAMSDFYPPGYHYAVAAAFRVFGESIATARAVSLAWSLASVVALYLFASSLFGRGGGVLAAIAWAFNRVEVTHSVAVMAESQFNALFLLGAWAAVLSYRRDRAWLWAITGLLAGAATLTKGLAYPLLFTALVLLALGWKQGRWPLRRAVVMLAVIGACYAIPQAPWAYQTYRYYGKPLYSHGYSVMICSDWSKSTYRTAPPTLREYLAENEPGYPLATRLRHVGKTARALPLAVSFGLPGVALVLAGAWVARGRMAALVIGMGVVYYGFVVLAAGGDLAWRERYLLPMLALMAILSAVAIARAGAMLPWKRNALAAWATLALLAVIGGWLTMRVPHPPQDVPRIEAYERLGKWVRDNTPAGAPLLCQAVQDVNYATGHPTVMDATRSARSMARLGLEQSPPASYERRSAEEAARYGVRYLVVDPNITADESRESLLRNLPGCELVQVYADDVYPLWLYAIGGPETSHHTPATSPAPAPDR